MYYERRKKAEMTNLESRPRSVRKKNEIYKQLNKKMVAQKCVVPIYPVAARSHNKTKLKTYNNKFAY